MKSIRKYIDPSPTVLGRIKVGELVPTANGFMRPKALDYFIIEPIHQIYMASIKKWAEAKNIDAKPSELPIAFATNDYDKNIGYFASFRKTPKDGVYARTNLQSLERLSEDGKSFEDITEELKAKGVSIEEAMQKLEAKYPQSGGFKEELTLKFKLVGLPIDGVWILRTGAKASSIRGILDAYTLAENHAAEFGGRIDQVPFLLGVKMAKSDKAGNGSVYPVISLRPYLPSNQNAALDFNIPLLDSGASKKQEDGEAN